MSSSIVTESSRSTNETDNTVIILLNETFGENDYLVSNEANATVSVVKVGDVEHNVHITTDAENSNPLVNLTVEGPFPQAATALPIEPVVASSETLDPYLLDIIDPEQLKRLENALQSEQAKQILGDNVAAMLDMLSADDEQKNITESIRMDHCYYTSSSTGSAVSSTEATKVEPVTDNGAEKSADENSSNADAEEDEDEEEEDENDDEEHTHYGSRKSKNKMKRRKANTANKNKGKNIAGNRKTPVSPVKNTTTRQTSLVKTASKTINVQGNSILKSPVKSEIKLEDIKPEVLNTPVKGRRKSSVESEKMIKIEIKAEVTETTPPRKMYPKRENRKPPAHLAEAFGPALFSTPDVPIPRRTSESKADDALEEPNTPELDSDVQSVENIVNNLPSTPIAIPEGKVVKKIENKRRSSATKTEEFSGRRKKNPSKILMEAIKELQAGSDDEEEEEEGGDSEDDPDRLWCICKKPHNNRFMICCDRCEDWFHGNCVGITKAAGKQMEARGQEWTCPQCLKIKQETEKKDENALITPTKIPDETSNDVSPETQQLESADNKIITPITSTGKQVEEERKKCFVCKSNYARPSGIYCSDDCIQKHVQDSLNMIKSESNKNTPVQNKNVTTPPTTPVADNHVTVIDRRTNKVVTGQEAPTPITLKSWLQKNPTCEVVSPGIVAALKNQNLLKSNIILKASTPGKTPIRIVTTKIIPPDQMSVLKSPVTQKQAILVPAQKLPTVKPTEKPAASAKQQNTAVTASKSVPVKLAPIKTLNKTSKTTSGAQPGKQSSTTQNQKQQSTKDNGKSNKTPAIPAKKREVTPPPSTKNSSASGEKSESQTEPRINVRKTLTGLLQSRVKECSDLKVSDYEITGIATHIEEELFNLFKDTGSKYKVKYRSLVFNIKDPKNLALFHKIAIGEISPHQLVRLSPEELARKELAQWREQETKHTLEMITKNELELLNQSKAFLMKTHKGEQLIETDDSLKLQALAVEAEQDETETAERSSTVDEASLLKIQSKEKTSKSNKKSSTSSKHRSSKSSKKRDRSRSLEKHRSTDRRRSKERRRSGSKERHGSKHHHHHHSSSRKDSTSSHKHSSSRSKSNKSSSNKHSSSSHRHSKSRHHSETGDSTDKNSTHSNSSISKTDENHSKSRHKSKTPPPTTTLDENEQTTLNTLNTEPSSTVVTKSLNDNAVDDSTALWKGILRVETGPVNVTLHDVSGETADIIQFLPSVLEGVGRIPPKVVFDYLCKMKKAGSKDITIVGIKPAKNDDKIAYLNYYTYLDKRDRFGVVGNKGHDIKDFYLMPLAAHTPLPAFLLPIEGPGLEDFHPHMFIGIIVKNKRKRTAETAGLSGQNSSKLKEAKIARSYTPPLPDARDSYTPPLPNKLDEEDMPYSPGDPYDKSDEEEDSTELNHTLQELNRKIEEQKQQIESISSELVCSNSQQSSESYQVNTLLKTITTTTTTEIPGLSIVESDEIQVKQTTTTRQVEDENEAYSPSRSFTPPPSQSIDTPPFLFTDTSSISLPSNLQEILASIQRNVNPLEKLSSTALSIESDPIVREYATTDEHLVTIDSPKSNSSSVEMKDDDAVKETTTPPPPPVSRDPRKPPEPAQKSLSKLTEEELIAKANEMLEITQQVPPTAPSTVCYPGMIPMPTMMSIPTSVHTMGEWQTAPTVDTAKTGVSFRVERRTQRWNPVDRNSLDSSPPNKKEDSD